MAGSWTRHLSTSLDDIAELGREVVARGFTALKTNIVRPGALDPVWWDQSAGAELVVTNPLLREIEALIGTFRDAVGPHVDISLDLISTSGRRP
jgi:L-alanine-DL-glutamate epimerase-like enolase superfamily enzyme